MAKYRSGMRRRIGVRWTVLLPFLILAALGAIIFATVTYYTAQLRPVSNNQQTEVFIVKKGSSVQEIASSLEDKKLIRSALAFRFYVQAKQLGGKVQAGSYALSPSQSVPSLAHTLTTGRATTMLVTIIPGHRIDQVRSDLINDGFAPDDVDRALDPGQYADVPIVAIKPQEVVTLEGLLWPDSFEKDQTTTASDIIRKSLTAMSEHYTAELQAAIAANGLSAYQGLTLASIVEEEVSKPQDQAQVAQVFYLRMQKGMKLGSDVTARYGAIAAGLSPSLTYASPYNTLMNPGLPPTPISTVNTTSLNAVAHPAGTNWLYFVAGDDGTTYFSTTFEQHQAYTDKYCHKLCGQ
jgi:UPF0755 protein